MIGRKGVIRKVLGLLRSKQNVIILGPGGIGKTTLLLYIVSYIVSKLGNDAAYYIEAIIPAKHTLQEAFTKISKYDKAKLKEIQFSRWTVPDLAKALIHFLAGRNFVLAIDGLDRASISSADWLRDLAESNITILGACRYTKEEKDFLDRFFWTTKKITLHPMPDGEILEIVRFQVSESTPPIHFSDDYTEELFEKAVIEQARGFPIIADQLCKSAAAVKEVTQDFISEISAQAHKASVKYIPLTPIILIPIIAFGAARYLFRITGNQELTIISGALMVGIIMIRFLSSKKRRKR